MSVAPVSFFVLPCSAIANPMVAKVLKAMLFAYKNEMMEGTTKYRVSTASI